MKNWFISFQTLVVIACVAADHYEYASRLASYTFPTVPLVKVPNSGRQLATIQITPQIEDMVRAGLQSMKYDPQNIRLEEVLTGKKSVGGRMVDLYRVSYMNPVLNQYCFFSFLNELRINPEGLVCNKPCAGDVCQVDTQLIHSASYDSSYNKNWEERKFHENKEVRHRNYNGAFHNDDQYNANYIPLRSTIGFGGYPGYYPGINMRAG